MIVSPLDMFCTMKRKESYLENKNGARGVIFESGVVILWPEDNFLVQSKYVSTK